MKALGRIEVSASDLEEPVKKMIVSPWIGSILITHLVSTPDLTRVRSCDQTIPR
jgi:hypothetical protein